MLNIKSNGSKWAGQEPDSIDELLEVLEIHPLDRTFEKYGNFIDKSPRWGRYGKGPNPYPDNPGVVIFFGNFYGLSHVFNIHTDEAEVIDRLAKTIRKNRRRTDYTGQSKPAAGD